MARVDPTFISADVFAEDQDNSTDNSLTTLSQDGTDLSIYNVTVPWSEFDPPVKIASCRIEANYTIVASLLAVICVLFGIFYTFFGYRFLKIVLFLTGFLLATVLLYMLLEDVFKGLLPPEGSLACAVGAGVLLGLLSMLITYVGLVLTGFCIGAAAAAAIMVLVEQFVHPPTMWVPVGVFLAIGLVFGLAGLKCPKTIVVCGTSIIGSAVCLAGVDYFLEQSRASLYVWDRLVAAHSSSLCWFSWLMLAVWPLLALVGGLIQWKCTGAGVNYNTALNRQGESTTALQEAKVSERQTTQQTRYRHLYQARRVRGDVISQSYLQSIQHKLSPQMQSLTALNVEANQDEDSTATTNLTQVTDHTI